MVLSEDKRSLFVVKVASFMLAFGDFPVLEILFGTGKGSEIKKVSLSIRYSKIIDESDTW